MLCHIVYIRLVLNLNNVISENETDWKPP